MRVPNLLVGLVALLSFLAAPASAQLSAPGAAYKSDAEGWQLTAPKAWKHGLKDGKLLIASDTEAGLMVAWFQAGATYEQVQQLATQPYQEPGLYLEPSGSKPFATKAGKAISVDYAGQGGDGTPLRSRAIAIVGAKGTVYVAGFTTEPQFAGLAKRVEELARSVSFFAPKVAAGVGLLQGSMCAYSGGSSYSSTQKVSFDGRGQASWGSEMVFGGDIKNSQGDTTASYGGWSGNANQPSDRGTYTVAGDQITIRWGDGSVMSCVAHHRVGGKITEMMCGKKLYGGALCN